MERWRRRRRSRYAQVSGPGRARTRTEPSRRARRIRRPRFDYERPYVAIAEELGLPQLYEFSSSDDRLSRFSGQAFSAHRAEGALRGGLYANDRRRSRGQRFDDLRPRTGEDGFEENIGRQSPRKTAGEIRAV